MINKEIINLIINSKIIINNKEIINNKKIIDLIINVEDIFMNMQEIIFIIYYLKQLKLKIKLLI